MDLTEANQLLEPGFLYLEAGYTRLGNGQLHKLRINSRDPSLILDTSRFSVPGVSAAVYGRVGPLEEPVWAGHVIHLCRDTANGCEMRSRFWLGDMDPPELAPDPEARIALFPDEVGQALLKHCIEEMEFLSICLPSLCAGHTTESET